MNRLNRSLFETDSRISIDHEDDDDRKSNVSLTHSGRPSRLYRDVTLEMIDDFINPLAKNKPQEHKVKLSGILPTATGGLGLRARSSSEYRFKHQDSTVPFSVLREGSNNFDYADIRRKYENKYWEQVDNQSQVGSVIRDEMSSVVGSAMSQIESVSTMSISTTKRQSLMNRMKQVERLNIEEEDENIDLDFDINNNLSSGLNKLLTQQDDLDRTFTEDDDRLLLLHLQEHLKVYKQRYDYDPKLPITSRRDEIISMIENNTSGCQFTIIQGGTGCGKTTQIPQYILDHNMKEKKYCNIIVTQPRRIAAISISRRVCLEHGWEHGSFCGYQIGLDRSKLSIDTRITYCTTGVLLQKLIGQRGEENFNKTYTHIILDEVHERDLDTDFVMLLIKLKSFGRMKAKIVLMSATINKEIFRDYFAMRFKDNLSVKYSDGRSIDMIYAPCIEIKTKMYHVKKFHWNNLFEYDSVMQSIFNQMFVEKKSKLKNQKQVGNSKRDLIASCDSIRQFKSMLENVQFVKEEPEMHRECMIMAIALLRFFNDKEKEDLNRSRALITRDNEDDEDFENVNGLRIIDGFPEVRGSVLIFVPGMEHIRQLQDLIVQELPNDKLNILPLHSDIVIDQQNRVFEKRNSTWRKVIISTSIAESSITVPDVKYVIDFCLTKELYCDPYTNYTHLRLEWASRSNLDQRLGRAGRVSDGMCFRLIPENFEEELEQFPIPAILREPLDQVILNVKRLERREEPKQILAMSIQPPKLIDIERTVMLLKEVGALSLIKNTPFDGNLTYAGRIMANLPIDVRLSKLILLGHAFGKLRECIIIAAGLSTKTFFTCYYKSHLESFKAKWLWSEGWMCDCITMLNAYNLYESQHRNRVFDHPGDEERWAKKNMIEIVRIREVKRLVEDLTRRLDTLGIKCNRHVKLEGLRASQGNNIYDIDDDEDLIKNNMILKMIFAGAFYPNYFTSIKIDLQETVRMCNGKDFRNTVQIRNLPLNEGILYSQKICEMFKMCSRLVSVHFEDTKGFVEFKSKCEEVASNVNLGVYLAVQMRLLRIPLRVKRLNAKITHEKLKRFKQYKSASSSILSSSFNSSRADRTRLTSSTSNTSMNDSQSQVSDQTIVNSDDEDFVEIQKLIDPEKYIREKREKYLSYETIEKSMNISILTSDKSVFEDEQALVLHLSDARSLLPAEVDQNKTVKVSITHPIECAHFWAQVDRKSNCDILNEIHDALNSDYKFDLMHPESVIRNSLCVTYYKDEQIGRAFYRAKIVDVDKFEKTATVIFVDYGNTAKRNFKDLYYLTDDLKESPFQALECKILNIKPSLLENPNGAWTKKSNQIFNKLLNDQKFQNFEILVHALDDNMAYVNLYGNTSNGQRYDFSDLLTRNGCAVVMNKTEIDLNLSKQYNKQKDMYYIPSRDSDYMTTRPRYANEDTEIRRAQSNFKNKYYGDNESMISEEDDSRSSLVSSVTSSLRSEVDYDENDESSFDGLIDIRGPFSPLECNYSSVLNIGQTKKVKVERDSINYVTIDDDPTNESTRLLIAHEVTLNTIGNTMVLRKTCLMPKLPGLPTICSLLFSPTIEMRTDRNATMYTGALCGLGYDEQNNMPIYSDNDVELAFDVKIDASDISMINSVRMAINMVIGSEQEVQTWTNDEKNLRALQQKACEKLLRLILRNREIIEQKYFSNPHRWNQVNKMDLIDLMTVDDINENKDLYYTYHKAIRLVNDDSDY